MKKHKSESLDTFRKQMFQDVKDLHMHRKLTHAVELITKNEVLNKTLKQRGELAVFGLESSVEQIDDLDKMFQDMWERDVRIWKVAEANESKQKEDIVDTVTYTLSWTKEELGELRHYMAKLREEEQNLAICNKMNNQAYEKTWETKFNDPVFIAQQTEALFFTKGKKRKEIVIPENKQWPDNPETFSGYFHLVGITDIDFTWARVVAVCSRLYAKVALHFTLRPDDPDQEMYIDLELVDFVEVATQIARHLKYEYYIQYYFLNAPTEPIAHVSQHYICAWPLKNGPAPQKIHGFFELCINVKDSWTTLQTILQNYNRTRMHSQQDTCFVFCEKLEFPQISHEIYTLLNYKNKIVYHS